MTDSRSFFFIAQKFVMKKVRAEELTGEGEEIRRGQGRGSPRGLGSIWINIINMRKRVGGPTGAERMGQMQRGIILAAKIQRLGPYWAQDRACQSEKGREGNNKWLLLEAPYFPKFPCRSSD